MLNIFLLYLESKDKEHNNPPALYLKSSPIPELKQIGKYLGYGIGLLSGYITIKNEWYIYPSRKNSINKKTAKEIVATADDKFRKITGANSYQKLINKHQIDRIANDRPYSRPKY
jgi:hypothetical protein